AILRLAGDRASNLWVGTCGGLKRLRRRLTSLIQAGDGLPFQGVQAVCQDATGALWLVGDNGVLVRGRGTDWITEFPGGPSIQTHATCVAASTNGPVWVGTWGGGLYQGANGQFTDLGLQASLHQKSPRSLLVTHN